MGYTRLYILMAAMLSLAALACNIAGYLPNANKIEAVDDEIKPQEQSAESLMEQDNSDTSSLAPSLLLLTPVSKRVLPQSISRQSEASSTPALRELLSRSVARQRESDNFRAVLNYGWEFDESRLDVIGEFEFNLGKSHASVNAIGPEGDKFSFEVISHDDSVFTNTGNEGWLRVSPSIVNAQDRGASGIRGMLFFQRFLDNTYLIPNAYHIEFLGMEDVGGTPSRRLKIHVDFPFLWQHLDDQQRIDFIRSLLPTTIGFNEELFEQADFEHHLVEVRKFEVWVDNEGFQRKGVMELNFPGAGNIWIRVRQFDFFEPIIIAEPENFQEITPQSLEADNIQKAIDTYMVDNLHSSIAPRKSPTLSTNDFSASGRLTCPTI